MENNNKKNEESDMFSAERQLLDDAKSTLENPQASQEELREELENLAKNYSSLLKQSSKLIRISDSNQRRLRKAQVTLEEQNERINKQNEELLQLNATKDKFFSIITHDLRNPITSIMLMSELIKTSADRFTSEQLIESVTKIFNSTKQLAELLDNLQRWSRTQTGKIEIHIEKIKAHNLLRETQDLLRLQANNKSIEINIDCPADAIVRADRNMLTTVLRNLASNAIKFSHPSSSVDISFFENENSDVAFKVKDSGVGISPENIEKLFLIDGKVQTPGTNKEAGTGLGLILCNEFAKKHGGKIIVSSEQGKGSEFTVLLPQPGD